MKVWISQFINKRKKKVSILCLPVELLCIIFEYCDNKSRLNLRGCSRLLKTLVDSHVWKNLDLDFTQYDKDNKKLLQAKVLSNVVDYENNDDDEQYETKIRINKHLNSLLWSLSLLKGNVDYLNKVQNLTIRLPKFDLQSTNHLKQPQDLSIAACRESRQETHDRIVSWMLQVVLPENCKRLKQLEIIKDGKLQYEYLSKFFETFPYAEKKLSGFDIDVLNVDNLMSVRLVNLDKLPNSIPSTVTELTLDCNGITVFSEKLKNLLPEFLEKLTMIGISVTNCHVQNSWLPETVHILTVDCSQPLNDIRMTFEHVQELRIHVTPFEPRPFDHMTFPSITKLYIENDPSSSFWPFEQPTVMPFFPKLINVQIEGARLMAVHQLLRQLPANINNLILSHCSISKQNVTNNDLTKSLDKIISAVPLLSKLILDLGTVTNQTGIIITHFKLAAQLKNYYVRFQDPFHKVNTKLLTLLEPITIKFLNHDFNEADFYSEQGYKVDISKLKSLNI